MGARPINHARQRRSPPPRMERRLTYGEIVKAKGTPIAVDATFNDSSKIHAASMCVQVAEVEVDPQTGQVELKKFTSTHNTGTVSIRSCTRDKSKAKHDGDRLFVNGRNDHQ